QWERQSSPRIAFRGFTQQRLIERADPMRRNLLRPENFVLLIALLTSSAQGAADWPVPRGESREPVPYRYDPAQWKTVPHEFLDDATACVLYSSANYLIEADGTIEAVTH